MSHPRKLVALAALLALGAAAHAEGLIGLTTSNGLVTFDSATPGSAGAAVAITGLGAGETMLAIDLRPTTGVLYGISSASNVYSLTSAGATTFISGLSSPLGSSLVGLDFNPVADLSGATSLRIVSSTGQNYAYNVATGATTVATGVQTDIGAVAYSNNDINAATATSLYYIDAAADLLKVATTNFNAPTIATVGALGSNITGTAGFDISSSGAAFAVLTTAAGANGLYSINLATGAATFAGAFGANTPQLAGLTAITAPVPEPRTYALMLAGLAAVVWVSRRRAVRSANT